MSCSADHKPISRQNYSALVNETLVLDLNDGGKDQNTTVSGADFRAVSRHNPDVAKAQISVFVSEH